MPEQLFHTEDEQFSFQSHGVTITCQRLNLPGYISFRVQFSSNRKPITIAQELNSNLAKFWTAVPEGQNREAEAKGVGKLIEEYLKNKE